MPCFGMPVACHHKPVYAKRVGDGHVQMCELIDATMSLHAYRLIECRFRDRIPDPIAHCCLGAFVVMPNHLHVVLVHRG